MLAASQSLTSAPPRARPAHQAQTNHACGNLQIHPSLKSATNPAFDGGGLPHRLPVFFSHPKSGPRNGPSAVILKKRRHRKFHRVLAWNLVVSYCSATALQCKWIQLWQTNSTCPSLPPPSKGGSFPTPSLHPSHLFRQPPCNNKLASISNEEY